MPELPEVEVLARHLRPLLLGKTIRGVIIRRAKVLRPTTPGEFRRTLLGAKFTGLSRRGKYLLFELQPKNPDRIFQVGRASSRAESDPRKESCGSPVVSPHQKTLTVLGHLGMTGRMFLARRHEQLPTHAAVIFDLGGERFIYEDTRYFGRLTLDSSATEKLGPEPLSGDFQPEVFAQALKRSHQAIKVKLLDQSVVAGVGNIYASEALYRARLSPKRAANRLTSREVGRLWDAIRKVMARAIRCGSTVPLTFGGVKSDGLFYFGRAPGTPDFYEERLRVYDREGRPCLNCRRPIRRITQAARSTYYCPHCQRG